jgi:ribose/xylose/arabinose/galactoside ABC-type transport system permease subunit
MRRVRAAAAGAGAALVWAAAEPAVRRLVGTDYSDIRLVGLPLHVANGALFGVAYGELRSRREVSPVVAALAEHVTLWPALAVLDRAAVRDPRAFASSGLCHAIFGVALGRLLRA